MSNELWRPIMGYEGLYEISSHGRVRNAKGKIRRLHSNHHGYHIVGLYRDAKGSCFKVHRLVLTAFVGPCPPGHECNHLNNIRTDNRIENLEWVTAKENSAHRARQGRSARAMAKITEDDVVRILEMRVQGFLCREIAAHFGMAASAISPILRGTNWSHVAPHIPRNKSRTVSPAGTSPRYQYHRDRYLRAKSDCVSPKSSEQ